MSASAAGLLSALEADSMARLKWRVLALLGVSPLSLRGRLLTKRRALRLACHLALDAGNTPLSLSAARGDRASLGGSQGANPNFDMARFTALGGRSDGI